MFYGGMWRKIRIKQELDWAEKSLRKVGVDIGRSVARGLMEYALAQPGAIPVAHSLRYREDEIITPAIRDKFRDAIFRRMRGEATSRIIGWREFWSLPFKLNAATLDPRPDTESVIEAVIKYLSPHPDYKNRDWRFLDMGTGTGCIIISLLHEFKNAYGFACDISDQALAAAAENAAINNVADRLALFAGNWAASLAMGAAQKFDVIASNPPYVAEYYRALLSPEVLHFDPPAALWGGQLGLDAYVEILPQIHAMLKPDGFAAFEMGADQSDALAQIVADHGMRVIDVVKDLAGHNRCMVIRHS